MESQEQNVPGSEDEQRKLIGDDLTKDQQDISAIGIEEGTHIDSKDSQHEKVKGNQVVDAEPKNGAISSTDQQPEEENQFQMIPAPDNGKEVEATPEEKPEEKPAEEEKVDEEAKLIKEKEEGFKDLENRANEAYERILKKNKEGNQNKDEDIKELKEILKDGSYQKELENICKSNQSLMEHCGKLTNRKGEFEIKTLNTNLCIECNSTFYGDHPFQKKKDEEEQICLPCTLHETSKLPHSFFLPFHPQKISWHLTNNIASEDLKEVKCLSSKLKKFPELSKYISSYISCPKETIELKNDHTEIVYGCKEYDQFYCLSCVFKLYHLANSKNLKLPMIDLKSCHEEKVKVRKEYKIESRDDLKAIFDSGKKPNDIQSSLVDSFIKERVMPNLKKSNITIEPYVPTQEDISSGFLTKSFSYEMIGKSGQEILETSSEIAGSLLVCKTVETLKNFQGSKVLIKTLRLLDPDQDFRTVKEILLEMLPDYDNILNPQSYRASITVIKGKIQYFKRVFKNEDPFNEANQKQLKDELINNHQPSEKDKKLLESALEQNTLKSSYLQMYRLDPNYLTEDIPISEQIDENLNYIHVMFSKPCSERYLVARKTGYDAEWAEMRVYVEKEDAIKITTDWYQKNKDSSNCFGYRIIDANTREVLKEEGQWLSELDSHLEIEGYHLYSNDYAESKTMIMKQKVMYKQKAKIFDKEEKLEFFCDKNHKLTRIPRPEDQASAFEGEESIQCHKCQDGYFYKHRHYFKCEQCTESYYLCRTCSLTKGKDPWINLDKVNEEIHEHKLQHMPENHYHYSCDGSNLPPMTGQECTGNGYQERTLWCPDCQKDFCIDCYLIVSDSNNIAEHEIESDSDQENGEKKERTDTHKIVHEFSSGQIKISHIDLPKEDICCFRRKKKFFYEPIVGFYTANEVLPIQYVSKENEFFLPEINYEENYELSSSAKHFIDVEKQPEEREENLKLRDRICLMFQGAQSIYQSTYYPRVKSLNKNQKLNQKETDSSMQRFIKGFPISVKGMKGQMGHLTSNFIQTCLVSNSLSKIDEVYPFYPFYSDDDKVEDAVGRGKTDQNQSLQDFIQAQITENNSKEYQTIIELKTLGQSQPQLILKDYLPTPGEFTKTFYEQDSSSSYYIYRLIETKTTSSLVLQQASSQFDEYQYFDVICLQKRDSYCNFLAHGNEEQLQYLQPHQEDSQLLSQINLKTLKRLNYSAIRVRNYAISKTHRVPFDYLSVYLEDGGYYDEFPWDNTKTIFYMKSNGQVRVVKLTNYILDLNDGQEDQQKPKFNPKNFIPAVVQMRKFSDGGKQKVMIIFKGHESENYDCWSEQYFFAIYDDLDHLVDNPKFVLLTEGTTVYTFEKFKFSKNEKTKVAQMSFLELCNKQEEINHNNERFVQTLIPEYCIDELHDSNLMPIILHQEQSQNENQGAQVCLIVLNLHNLQVESIVSINPEKSVEEFISKENIQISRSSDMIEEGATKKMKFTVAQYIETYENDDYYKGIYTIQLSNYCIEQTAQKKNWSVQVHLENMKIILPSEDIRSNISQQGYDRNFYLMPLYESVGNKVIGTQLQSPANGEQVFVNLMNSDFIDSTQYPIKSTYARTGAQRLYVDTRDSNSYFLVARSELLEDSKKFELFEQYTLLREQLIMILHTIPFTLESALLSGIAVNKNNSGLFERHEILRGKTQLDLYVNNPNKVSEFLQTKDNDKKSKRKTILEQHALQLKDKNVELLQQYGIMHKDIMISQDFNFTSQIELAFDVEAYKTAEILIQHIMGLEDSQNYQKYIMEVVPQILQLKQIPQGFLKFFDKDPLYVDKETCNLEINLLSPRPPEFSDRSQSAQLLGNYFNYMNFKKEVVHFLKLFKNLEEDDKDDLTNVFHESELLELHHKQMEKKEEQKVKKEEEITKSEEKHKDSHMLVKVRHSIIDFRYLILSRKLMGKFETFDHFYLSNLIGQTVRNKNVFSTQTIRSIIDMQYEIAQPMMFKTFLIYLLGFFIPFFATMFVENVTFRKIAYLLNAITLLFFFVIELIQIKFMGKQYFKRDGWNYFDSLMIPLFIIFIIPRAQSNFEPASSFYDILFTIMLILNAFVKLQYFMRIFEEYGVLVTMVSTTLTKLVAFMIYFITWILLFAVCFKTLKAEFDNGDYPNFSNSWVTIVQSYRNSIGDIATPSYEFWTENHSADSSTQDQVRMFLMIDIIWLFWWANQVLNLIILLNFLIAVISQVYDEVISAQQDLVFTHKSELNQEYFMLVKFFGSLKPFNTIVFSVDSEDQAEDDDAWLGFVQSIKNHQNKQSKIMRKEIKKVHDEMLQEFNTQAKKQEEKHHEIIGLIQQNELKVSSELAIIKDALTKISQGKKVDLNEKLSNAKKSDK